MLKAAFKGFGLLFAVIIIGMTAINSDGFQNRLEICERAVYMQSSHGEVSLPNKLMLCALMWWHAGETNTASDEDVKGLSKINVSPDAGDR